MPEASVQQETETKEKIPLSLRLKAWWEGYDAGDLWAKVVDGMPESDDLPDQQDGDSPDTPSADDKKIKICAPAARPTMAWDDRRVEIAQFVWGQGYCGPGGPEHIVAMSKLLALSPEMSVLVLGAELGGPARTLAKEFGAWISGYEESKELVEAGNKLSEAAGLAKKAKLQVYNLNKPKPLSRQFDRVFSKEALFTVKNLPALFETIEADLKGDGLILITDYVANEESDLGSKEIREWRKQEPKEPFLVTHDQLVKTIENAQLSIRVNEDITDQYVKLIADSWSNADKLVAELVTRGDESKELIDTLLEEAEFWSRRSRLLESGKLRLWRVVAHKKVLQSLMSDW